MSRPIPGKTGERAEWRKGENRIDFCAAGRDDGSMKRWLGILAAGGVLCAAGAAWGGDGFAFRLWRSAAGKEGNAVMSPFSVAEAMGMALAGARGETAREIARAVLPDGVEDVPGYFARLNADFEEAAGPGRLRIANALWSREGTDIPEGYVQVAAEAFGGLAETSPWGAEGMARANRWAAEATEGRIRELFDADMFGEDSVMVLGNAVFFRGKWATGFHPKATKAGAFRLRGGRTGRVPMMFRKGKAEMGEWEEGAMLRLPYEGGDLEMRVVVPKDGVGLEALEERLESDWDAWAEVTERCEAKVWLPRFKLRWGAASLKESLERLGVVRAFGPGADFSKMGAGGSALGDVVHAAAIEVDEEGTTAAAGTAAAMAKGIQRLTPEFRADRPFLFAIVEKVSGTVLFFGRVERPDEWVADEGEEEESGKRDDVAEAVREESRGAEAVEEREDRK